MNKFTPKEIEILTEEILNISRKINNNIEIDLDLSYKKLRELLQETDCGYNESEKILSLNTQVNELQKETIELCTELKDCINENIEDV